MAIIRPARSYSVGVGRQRAYGGGVNWRPLTGNDDADRVTFSKAVMQGTR